MKSSSMEFEHMDCQFVPMFLLLENFHQFFYLKKSCTNMFGENLAIVFSNLQILWPTPVGSQEYRRILFFCLLPYLVCSQSWLNDFATDHHFGYITKSFKETLVWTLGVANMHTLTPLLMGSFAVRWRSVTFIRVLLWLTWKMGPPPGGCRK